MFLFLYLSLRKAFSGQFLCSLIVMQTFMPQISSEKSHQKVALSMGLPQYAGIQTDIDFWERVYNDHDSDQCLLVDEKNLYRVFEVVDLPRGRRAKRRKVNKAIAKVKKSLFSISKKIARKPSLILSKSEKKVKQIISSKTLDTESYRKITKQLRCQRGLRDSLKLSFKIAQTHLPTVMKEIKKLNMPADLAYLPYLESGYRHKARSPVGARGLWQLMPATAREAGLKVNSRLDQRLDVSKSTRAALLELKKYHANTKSWGLALTSYVYGHNGVIRAMKNQKTNSYVYIRANYSTKVFQFASKSYYPRLIAIRNVMQESKTDTNKPKNELAENKEQTKSAES